MRKSYELKDGWKFVKSAAGINGAIAAEGQTISLPHTWNAKDGQDGGNDYYRGVCWYVRYIARPEMEETDHVYLEFFGAAQSARVYWNGEECACHDGGYSTFRVDVTDRLEDNNMLVVELDNSDNQKVYPQKADFTFYGGLYRMVNLLVVPEAHFALDYWGGPGIKVTPALELGQDRVPTRNATITVETWIRGNAKNVSVTIQGETSHTKVAQVVDGKATVLFLMSDVHLWNGTKDPYLYTATATLDSGDEVSVRFGCRSFYTDPQKGFMLNGESYPLRGVSRHQDFVGVGNALTMEHHKRDMELIQEMGANTLRLAHYQHAQEFYDLCDETGMVVWAEIPFITLFMEDGKENTYSQMRELVIQNYHHASIVCWGLSNEITAASAVTESLLENHRKLNEICHSLDATRFTTMANVFMQETDSPLLEIPDVNSYNLYFGWYLGELEQNDEFFDEYHSKYPERVIGFSEYGADANPAFHSSHPTHGDYSEEYQCVYHEHMLKLIEQRPYLWATHVWNMFDFAADGRDEGGKHGLNQKGLVTIDRELKKDAFYLYKAYWNKRDAFVHLCGRRYAKRPEERTQIKVYTNQPEVCLYVDDRLVERKSGREVFVFEIPLVEEHRIKAVAGGHKDEMTICKVDKMDPDYVLGDVVEVVNWFDNEAYDPTCFSIKDKMSDLQASPKAGAILAQMMSQGAGARGDVAESVKDNPNLVRMMGRMTLESLLGHMKDTVTEEQIKGLNRVLQQIKKSE